CAGSLGGRRWNLRAHILASQGTGCTSLVATGVLCTLHRVWRRAYLHAGVVAVFVLQRSLWIAIIADVFRERRTRCNAVAEEQLTRWQDITDYSDRAVLGHVHHSLAPDRHHLRRGASERGPSQA